MAYPVVQSRATGRTTAADVTSHAITMPAGIVAGNLLLVVFSSDGSPTCTASAGWTKLGQASNTTVVTGAVFWKIAAGGDTLTVTTSVVEQSSHVSLRISGASEVTGTSSNGSSTNSDPPNHTTPYAVESNLWIATRSGDSTVVATAGPAGSASLQTIAGVGTSSASTNTAEVNWNINALDPGVFTSATEQWVSWTLAVRPVSGGLPIVKAHTVIESFSSPSTDPPWRAIASGASFTGGQMRLSPPTLTPDYAGYEYTAAHLDLTDSKFSFEVVDPGNQGIASWQANMAVMTDSISGQSILWQIDQGNIRFASTVAGQLAGGPNDPVAYRWLQFRVTGAAWAIEVGPDGTNWNTIITGAVSTLGMAINDLVLMFEAGKSNGEETQTSACLIDNLNTLGPTGQALPLAGTIPLTTTTAGSIGMVAGAVAHPLAGTVAALTTTASAPLRSNLAAAGITAAVTSAAGTPTAVHPLSGALSAVTAVSGSPAARHPLAGLLPATTTTGGTVRAEYRLIGALPAVTTTSGTVRATYRLIATVPAVTTTVGSFVSVSAGGKPSVYVSGSWQTKPVKVNIDGNWVEKPMKRWDGTEWKLVGAPAVVADYFLDTFNRTAANVAALGNGWHDEGAVTPASANGSDLVWALGGGYDWCILGTPTGVTLPADYGIEVVAPRASWNALYCGIFLRMDPSDNQGVKLFLLDTGSAWQIGSSAGWDWWNGPITLDDGWPAGWTDNTDHTVRLEVVGTRVDVYADGQHVGHRSGMEVSWCNSGMTGTQVGFCGAVPGGSARIYRSIRVYPLP